MRTKKRREKNKKKEANIQPFDHKSLLLLFGRGPNRVMEMACFDVTSVNLKKVGIASRNIVIKNNIRCYESALQLMYLSISAAPSPHPPPPSGLTRGNLVPRSLTFQWKTE